LVGNVYKERVALEKVYQKGLVVAVVALI